MNGRVHAFYQLCTFVWGVRDQKSVPVGYSEKERFECPVCGSTIQPGKVTTFDGPAPRSLDQFTIEIVVRSHYSLQKQTVTEVAIEAPYDSPSPDAEIVVDTGID